MNAGPCDMEDWGESDPQDPQPEHEVTIAVVGKYIDHRDAYKSIYELLDHAGIAFSSRVIIKRFEAEELALGCGGAPGGGSTAFWCPAALEYAGSKGKSRRCVTRGRCKFRILESVWECKWR
ncbi:MAG: hypothetical protein U0872_12620 [Planctomycetaceae bacterium]